MQISPSPQGALHLKKALAFASAFFMASRKGFEPPTPALGDTDGNDNGIPYNTSKSPYVRGFLRLKCYPVLRRYR